MKYIISHIQQFYLGANPGRANWSKLYALIPSLKIALLAASALITSFSADAQVDTIEIDQNIIELPALPGDHILRYTANGNTYLSLNTSGNGVSKTLINNIAGADAWDHVYLPHGSGNNLDEIWVGNGETILLRARTYGGAASLIFTETQYDCDLGIVPKQITNRYVIGSKLGFGHTVLQNFNFGTSDCTVHDSIRGTLRSYLDTLPEQNVTITINTTRILPAVRIDTTWTIKPGEYGPHTNAALFQATRTGEIAPIPTITETAYVDSDEDANPRNDTFRLTGIFSRNEQTCTTSAANVPQGWSKLIPNKKFGQFIGSGDRLIVIRRLAVRIRNQSQSDTIIGHIYNYSENTVRVNEGTPFVYDKIISRDTTYGIQFTPRVLPASPDRYYSLRIGEPPFYYDGQNQPESILAIEYRPGPGSAAQAEIAVSFIDDPTHNINALELDENGHWQHSDQGVPFIIIDNAFDILPQNSSHRPQRILLDLRDHPQPIGVVTMRSTVDPTAPGYEIDTLTHLGGGMYALRKYCKVSESIYYTFAIDDEVEYIDNDCLITTLANGDRYRRWQVAPFSDTLAPVSFGLCDIVRVPGSSCSNSLRADSIFNDDGQLRNLHPIDTRYGGQDDEPLVSPYCFGEQAGRKYGIPINGGGRWMEFQVPQTGRYKLSFAGIYDDTTAVTPQLSIALYDRAACLAAQQQQEFSGFCATLTTTDTTSFELLLDAEKTYSIYVRDKHRRGSRMHLSALFLTATDCSSTQVAAVLSTDTVCFGESLLLDVRATQQGLDIDNSGVAWLLYNTPPSVGTWIDAFGNATLFDHRDSVEATITVGPDRLSAPGSYYLRALTWNAANSPWLQAVDTSWGCQWQSQLYEVEVVDYDAITTTLRYIGDSIYVDVAGGSMSSRQRIVWSDGLIGSPRTKYAETTEVDFVITDDGSCVDVFEGTADTELLVSTYGVTNVEWSVQPNPTYSNSWQIRASEPIDELQLTDLLGRQVRHRAGGSNSFDLQVASPGFYILQVTFTSGAVVTKTVIAE